jgi:carboxyl-terminal processing protease
MSEAQTAKHLIIDLRGNGGGEIGNLRHLLGYLTPFDKPVGTFIDRSIADDYTKAIHGDIKDLAAIAKWTKKKLRPIVDQNVPIFTGTIAVLIDGQSGSASEIAAQGLRDVLGSKVLGSKSAGAVLVSLYVGATNGFMLQFPLSDYVTIHGVRLEGLGVTPDIVVPDTSLHPTLETDPVVQKALSVLEEKKG